MPILTKSEIRNGLLFLVSGIHPILPYYEILSILDLYDIPYKIKYIYNQVISLKTYEKALDLVRERSTLTHMCGYEIIKPCNNFNIFLDYLRKIDWKSVIDNSFAVRVKKIGYNKINSMEIERKIGKILYKISHKKVNLKTPDTLLIVVISENQYILFKLKYDIRRQFGKRSLNVRPFVHPSTLTPRFAKLLTNLGMVKNGGNILLDPFVGMGSILIESSLLGIYVIGIDILWSMCKKCLANLKFLNIFYRDIICGDGKNPPLRDNSIKYIITDPPYGRKAPLYSGNLYNLLRKFLNNCRIKLKENGRIVIITPEEVKLDMISEKYDKIAEFKTRIHRNLTRRITILKL